MASVLLLRGQPGHGKSFAASVLKARGCVDAVLGTDELYVGYVFTRERRAYHDGLRQDIMAHYLYHLVSLGAAWEGYLSDVVSRDARRVDGLLVEGWHLTFCFDHLTDRLAAEGHQVLNVLVEERRYSFGSSTRMAVDEFADRVAALMRGQPDRPNG